MNKMNAIRILLLLAVFLAVPFTGSRLTKPITLYTPRPVYAQAYGQCLRCQTGFTAAWFTAYDECRHNDPNSDPQICTQAGDRAAACYVIQHWVGECQACDGTIPDESECAE